MTVPTTGTLPVPPIDTALLLDRAANLVQLARDDIEDLLAQLPDTTPLWSVVDLTAAHGHLLCAIKKIDKAADRISGTEVN